MAHVDTVKLAARLASRRIYRFVRWPATWGIALFLMVLIGAFMAVRKMPIPKQLPPAVQIERLYARYRREFPTVRDTSVARLLEEPPGLYVLIDVRTPEERAVSVLPGAISVDEFERDRERYRHRPVVAYCTIGYRSGVYAAALGRDGVDVRNLQGGILAWCFAGQPVTGPSGPTRRVHVYGKRWDLLPAGYTAVW